MTAHASTFLHRILVADAAISGVTGLALLAGAAPLAALLDVPIALLRVGGLLLIPFSAIVLLFANQISRARVWIVIAMNAAWVGASIAVLFGGWIEPNAFGVAFVLFQAAVVAVLAELQLAGLRRSAAPA